MTLVFNIIYYWLVTSRTKRHRQNWRWILPLHLWNVRVFLTESVANVLYKYRLVHSIVKPFRIMHTVSIGIASSRGNYTIYIIASLFDVNV